MKLEKLKGAEIKKNEMISIKGGTSTTAYYETGVYEEEFEDCNKDGKLDDDEKKNKSILIQVPGY